MGLESVQTTLGYAGDEHWTYNALHGPWLDMLAHIPPVKHDGVGSAQSAQARVQLSS